MTKQRNLIREPIFICGCHRTGTTLLQTILSRHSQLDILPETKLYAWQWHPITKTSATKADEKLREITTLMPFINRAWGLSENNDRMAGLKNSRPPQNGFSTSVPACCICWKTRQCPPRVLAKNPHCTFITSMRFEEIPDAKILITQRDLRGAFYSQSMRSRRKKLSYRSFKLFNFVASWLIAMRLTQQYLSKHGDKRIHVIKFESLVQSPADTLETACQFLGIDFESAMVDVQFENSSFEKAQNVVGIDAQSASRWQTELPADTKARLDYLGYSELNQAGYDVSNARPKFPDRLTRIAINTVNSIAVRNPQLVCYAGRDSRYVKLHRQYLDGKFDEKFGPELFILGNHKSGTTAIAALLAKLCGMSSTIDFPGNIRKDGYAMIRGELTFEDIVNRHPALFCRQIVKIPALTFVADEVAARFPDSKFLFVVRDPRDNIRSILNRRKIPGDKKQIPAFRRWLMKLQKRPSMDANVWGKNDHGYVGVLAQRWNLAIDALDSIEPLAKIIKYEDFSANKLESLNNIAQQFEFTEQYSVRDIVDRQFQPAGDRKVTWQDFFGPENLDAIQAICFNAMVKFGYTPEKSASDFPSQM